MRKHMASLITGCRIIGSILLMFLPVFSAPFYMTYLLCGFSDMVDGTIARKTNSSSEFGAGLDTVADFVFTGAALVKFLPLLRMPGWLCIWIAVIAMIKIGNMILGEYLQEKADIPAYDDE